MELYLLVSIQARKFHENHSILYSEINAFFQFCFIMICSYFYHDFPIQFCVFIGYSFGCCWFLRVQKQHLINCHCPQSPETLKYWVAVQPGQSYLMGTRCLFSTGWPHFYRLCHNKNALWGKCFTLNSFAPYVFLLGWLKLNLVLLLDQLRLA